MYKAYIISLANSGSGIYQEEAKHTLPNTLASCNTHNWQYEIFDAVNGFTMDNSAWSDHSLVKPTIKSNKFGDKPGAQGCFMSHFRLWQTCVDQSEPIIVLEDDAKIIAPMPLITSTQDLVKLHAARKINNHPTMGVWGPGAFAYWLAPSGAKKLIEYVKSNVPTYADKLIASNVLNWEHINQPVVKLGPRVGSSTNPEKYPLLITC